MAAHTGEKARDTGDFVCSRCDAEVHVEAGEAIPECPNCGSTTFDERRHEGRYKDDQPSWASIQRDK